MAEDWARPVVHWEIRAGDPERLRSFYSALDGPGLPALSPPATR